MLRFCVLGGAIGALIPAVFVVLLRLLAWSQTDPGGDLFLVFGRARLLLWPSSVFLLATAGTPAFEFGTMMIYLVSVSTNAALYTITAGILWYGINQSQLTLFVLASVLLAGWYALLRL